MSPWLDRLAIFTLAVVAAAFVDHVGSKILIAICVGAAGAVGYWSGRRGKFDQ
jgi:hypothetical protein